MVTDVVMPGGMNGDELAEAALVQRPDVKILFTSGYAEPAIATQGMGAGAWLKKPYTAAELAHKIQEVLGAAKPEPKTSTSSMQLRGAR